LELPPSLAGHQLVLSFAESIPCPQIWKVLLGIGEPGENFLAQNEVTESLEIAEYLASDLSR